MSKTARAPLCHLVEGITTTQGVREVEAADKCRSSAVGGANYNLNFKINTFFCSH